jgi:hypothetical protein
LLYSDPEVITRDVVKWSRKRPRVSKASIKVLLQLSKLTSQLWVLEIPVAFAIPLVENAFGSLSTRFSDERTHSLKFLWYILGFFLSAKARYRLFVS